MWELSHTGWPKKTGPACFIANILKTLRPNCVEILWVLACLFTHYRLVWWRHIWRSFIYFRSHTVRDTGCYLQRNNVAFIEPDVWPPNSLDLNPVNYAVWEALRQLVYPHRSFTSVAELKQAIINAWQVGRNCRSRLLAEASTNDVVALSAYIRMGAISNICLNK